MWQVATSAMVLGMVREVPLHGPGEQAASVALHGPTLLRSAAVFDGLGPLAQESEMSLLDVK